MSDPTRISDSAGGSFTAKLRLVRKVVPVVETTGTADATVVFDEFAKLAGPDVAPIGEASPHDEESGRVTVGGAGSMVVYGSVRRVEASFTYRCGGVATSGVITSWGQLRTGILQCGYKSTQPAAVVKEVTALAC